MNGMKKGSGHAVNGMDGKGNGSVTMDTVGRHWRTKTRHGSTTTSARVIADMVNGTMETADRERNGKKRTGGEMMDDMMNEKMKTVDAERK